MPCKHGIYIKACFAGSKQWGSLLHTVFNTEQCDCGVRLRPGCVKMFRKEISLTQGWWWISVGKECNKMVEIQKTLVDFTFVWKKVDETTMRYVAVITSWQMIHLSFSLHPSSHQSWTLQVFIRKKEEEKNSVRLKLRMNIVKINQDANISLSFLKVFSTEEFAICTFSAHGKLHFFSPHHLQTSETDKRKRLLRKRLFIAAKASGMTGSNLFYNMNCN